MALPVFDEGDDDPLQGGQIRLVRGQHLAQERPEVDTVRAAEATIAQVLDVKVVQPLSALVLRGMFLRGQVREVLGQIIRQEGPGILFRDVRRATPRALDSAQGRVSGRVTESAGVRVAALTLLESHPVMKRLRRRRRHDGGHDRAHQQLDAQSMQKAHDVWVIVAPPRPQAPARLVHTAERAVVCVEPVNLVQLYGQLSVNQKAGMRPYP